VLSDRPHLARLLWLKTVIDAAIHRQWLHRMATGLARPSGPSDLRDAGAA
jgi:hypothetical protein